MAMKIDVDFLKTSLPVLETELKETYSRLTSIFKEIIAAETENEAFFKSPLSYLDSQQALPSLATAKGQKLPLIQEEALVQTIRKARELYKAGKLELDNITAHSEYTSEKSWTFSASNKSWNPDTYTVTRENKGAGLSFKGVNALEIDGRLIGPLADPSVFEKLRASVETESKKAKG